METQSKMQNPVEQYAKPPYEDQRQQPVPGTESEMIPKADHGETSYKGTGKLTGRKAVITGEIPV